MAGCDGSHQNGEADYAVFPIENSSAGIVSENYDLMVEYNNYIVGEQIIRIDHALLGLPEADMDDITDIYSHPQALMQCSKYLESHRDWEKHSLKNTAMSAQKIKEDGKNKAAIASTLTADIYGLKVLDEAIQNNKIIIQSLSLWQTRRFLNREPIRSVSLLKFRMRAVRCTISCPILSITEST